MISAYFSQILKTRALSIPKVGILNIHPGLLPEYKGAMAYFWAVNNGESQAGVTIHWMDEGIDTGPILMRKPFRISKKMSQERVLIRTAVLGSRMVHRIGKKLAAGKTVKVIPPSNKKNNYYSMPTSEDYHNYRVKNKFFTVAAIQEDEFGLCVVDHLG